MSWQYPQMHRILTYLDLVRALVDDTGTLRSPITLINTLPASDQACLIHGTISATDEEKHINDLLLSGVINRSAGPNPAIGAGTVVVYGRNASDRASTLKKCNQLIRLGASDVRLYAGGLFEWLLLRKLYGADMFPLSSGTGDGEEYGGEYGEDNDPLRYGDATPI